MRIVAGLFPQQILQRDRDNRAVVTASGQTTARGPVQAVIQGLRGGSRPRVVGSARAGRFSLRLPGLPTGGPYTVILRCGDDSLAVREIRVGDVWLLAGQSNMQACGYLEARLVP